ncbi:MAG: hypothetical protein M1828_003773 [Chrysothrix sp. TS-e1954]|nr:MAG: hypothetical protein M1828_003773 [Chrysothrix sp. TS-e1954]
MVLPKREAIFPASGNAGLIASHLTIARFDRERFYDSEYQTFAQTLKDLSEKLPTYLQTTTPDVQDPVVAHTTTLPDGRSELPPDSDEDEQMSLKTIWRGLSLEDQGAFKTAGETFREAIADGGSTLPADHRNILFCRMKQSTMLALWCDIEKAEKQCSEAMKSTLSSGNFQGIYLWATATLARILEHKNAHGQAYSVLRSAMTHMHERLLQSKEGSALASVMCRILRDQGYFGTAEMMSRDVLSACRDLFGDRHTLTSRQESDLGMTLCTTNHYALGERLVQRAHENLIVRRGENHPDTLRTTRHLGDCFRFQGQLSRAREVLERTLQTQQETDETPPLHLSFTQSSLAAVAALELKLDEAEWLLHRALESFKDASPRWHRAALQLIEMRRSRPEDADISTIFDLYFQLPQQNGIALFNDRPKISELLNFDRDRSTEVPEETQGRTISAVAKACSATATNDVNAVQAYLDMDQTLELDVFWGGPLQVASASGNDELVNLLREGANVPGEDGLLGSPLRIAALEGDVNIMKLLLPAPKAAVNDAVRAAIVGGQVEALELLLDDPNFDANQEDFLFGTPLQEAAAKGQIRMVEKLLKAGGDPNLDKGAFGNCLVLAAAAGHTEVIRVLLENDKYLPPNVVYSNALRVAMVAGHLETAEILLAYSDSHSQQARVADGISTPDVPQHTVMKLLERINSNTPDEPKEVMRSIDEVPERVPSDPGNEVWRAPLPPPQPLANRMSTMRRRSHTTAKKMYGAIPVIGTAYKRRSREIGR